MAIWRDQLPRPDAGSQFGDSDGRAQAIMRLCSPWPGLPSRPTLPEAADDSGCARFVDFLPWAVPEISRISCVIPIISQLACARGRGSMESARIGVHAPPAEYRAGHQRDMAWVTEVAGEDALDAVKLPYGPVAALQRSLVHPNACPGG